MLAFLAGDADVLVTTSIIESGIDIPTANTLIVERADMLGLAQLYQIRGRIGRSEAYAYAYLLYPSEEMLTTRGGSAPDDAERPHRARRRLPHRHAPTSRSAGRATCSATSSRGTSPRSASRCTRRCSRRRSPSCAASTSPRSPPVRLDVPVTAYVPPGYIAYEATKVDAHRRIARAATLGELGDVRAELADRFGAPPGPVENLLALQALRIKAGELGLRAVTLRAARLQLDGLELDTDGAARLRAALPRAVYLAQRAVLTVHGDGAAPADDDGLNERSQALMWVEEVLDAILDARATADLSSDPGSHNS